MPALIESIREAYRIEASGHQGEALDLLWDTVGPACEQCCFSEIDSAFGEAIDGIEGGDDEPEPFTLLGVLMITLPCKLLLPARERLWSLTRELFSEWEWDTEELEAMR